MLASIWKVIKTFLIISILMFTFLFTLMYDVININLKAWGL